MNTHNISKVSQKKHRALREECRRVGRLPEFKEPSCLDHPAIVIAKKNLVNANKNIHDMIKQLNSFSFACYERSFFLNSGRTYNSLICKTENTLNFLELRQYQLDSIKDIFNGKHTFHDPEGNMCKGVKRDKKKWNKRPEHPKHTPLVGKKLKKYKSNHQKTKLLEDIDLDDELVL
jgi:hypothetical protein